MTSESSQSAEHPSFKFIFRTQAYQSIVKARAEFDGVFAHFDDHANDKNKLRFEEAQRDLRVHEVAFFANMERDLHLTKEELGQLSNRIVEDANVLRGLATGKQRPRMGQLSLPFPPPPSPPTPPHRA